MLSVFKITLQWHAFTTLVSNICTEFVIWFYFVFFSSETKNNLSKEQDLEHGIPLYFSKYIGLLWYAGVSGSTTDFDKSRESKQCSERKKIIFMKQ